MGIEKFFSTLSNIKNLWSENKYPYNKVKSSILLIDFNAIVHLTSSRVLKKYNKDSTSDFIEEQILLNIKKFLKHLLNNVLDNKNLKYIYIAIDGVPTFGKMREQIKRRYIGKIISSLSNDTTIWSKGNITPGTKFMSKLNIYLEEIINELKKGLPKIKDIILSGSDQSGEGEMKIIDYLKNIKLESKSHITVFSPDSDMVLLNLLIKGDYNVKLLRYNQQKSDLTTLDNNTDFYEVLDMKDFRKYLFDYVSNNLPENFVHKLDERKIIRDIILIFNCFGNDFLPKIVSINLRYDFILAIDIYILCLNKYLYIINLGNIDFDILKEYFILLSKYEYDNLKIDFNRMIYTNYDSYINNILDKDISIIKNGKKNVSETFLYLILKLINKKELINKIKTNKEFKNGEKVKKYGSLYIYKIKRDELIDDLLLYYTIEKKMPFYQNNNYKNNFLKKRDYNSKSDYHQKKINELDIEQIEIYKMTNFLDEYNKKLNPSIFDKITDMENMEKYYNKKYLGNNESNAVKEYMKGINWIFGHYLKRKNDGFWYYKYSHAPLLKTIIKYFDVYKKDIKIEYRKHDLTPVEQFIIVSPYDKKNIELIDYDSNKIKNIYDKLFKHNLLVKTKDIKLENVDCSGSIFFNKCHPEIIDKIDFQKIYDFLRK